MLFPWVINCNHVLVNAYGTNGMGLEAVHLYWSMPKEMRDSISHVCVLNACSHAGLIDEATRIYGKIHLKTERITVAMVCHSINHRIISTPSFSG